MGRPISKVEEVRVPGPLAPFAAGFKSALLEAGYTPLSAVVQMRLMVHLSRWLDARGLSAVDLTGERIEAYLAARRAAGYRERNTRRGLAPLLEHLAARNVLPAEESRAPGSGAQALLASFEAFLLSERGLVTSTASAYVTRAARFLSAYAADGDVAAVTPADITHSVLEECTSRSVGAGQYFVAALRSFLRFCHIQGLIS